MKLSDRAKSHISEREAEERHDAFNKSANDRKRGIYWIGFLEGALSSKQIEKGEEAALHAEAKKFAEFFNDPDASDLAEDICARCFSSDFDLMDQLRQIIEVKRDEIAAAAPYSETDEMNEFLGFCAGIICDGRIVQAEAESILARFRQSSVLMTAAPFQQLRRAIEQTMADQVLTEKESEEIQEWIAMLVGDGFIDTGLPNIGAVARLDDPIRDPAEVRLNGAVFVLTGPMRMGTRSHIQLEIRRVGGHCEDRTTRKTDYVVVSSTASRHWRTTHFGTKIERARELIDEGFKLRFVSEIALEQAIALADASV